MLNQLLSNMRVILASTSEQRRILLQSTRVKFEVQNSDYEENLNPAEHTFSRFVEETAVGKVVSVYERLKPELDDKHIIIGADTMVTYNGKMYGKPKSNEDAVNIISDLTQSGLPNSVYTGVAIEYLGHIHTFTEVSTVYMDKLDREEILAYVESGEPMGKAGGYGIQGIASTFVTRIEGDCNNVIGLPLCRLRKELKRILSQN